MQREADIFSFARCGSPCGYSEKAGEGLFKPLSSEWVL